MTVNDCVTCVPSAGSVAVTVIVAVSPGIRLRRVDDHDAVAIRGSQACRGDREGVDRLRILTDVFGFALTGMLAIFASVLARRQAGRRPCTCSQAAIGRRRVDEELRIIRVGPAGVGQRHLVDARQRQLLDVFVGERRAGLTAGAGPESLLVDPP